MQAKTGTSRVAKSWIRLALCAALFGVVPGVLAQNSIDNAVITREIGVLASHAGLIFVGQIVSIHRQGGLVHVVFRVEQSISGNAGPVYDLREWAGLWPMGQHRYSVGQRVLAFLHPAGAAGATSPVHGAEGLVPVVVQGANAPRLLDIRRIAASVVRSANTPLPTQTEGALPLTAVLASLGRPDLSRVPGLQRLPLPVRAHPPAALEIPHTFWSNAGFFESIQPGPTQPVESGIHAAR